MSKKRSIHVLVVEDNSADFRYFIETLSDSDESFEIVQASSHEQAREQLSHNRFDSIVMDMNLPDAHGGDLFEAIHREAPQTPIVILSGMDADQTLKSDMIRLGAQDFLDKNTLSCSSIVQAIQFSIERNKLKEKIRQSEERFKLLSEASPFGIVVLDAHGKCSYSNPAFQTIHGVSAEESRADGWHQTVHPEDVEKVSSGLIDNTSPRERFELEYRVLMRNGQAKILRTVANCLSNDNSAEDRYILFIEDITEAKMVQQMKDDFIGVVSHELRTPLSIIKGHVENLTDGLLGELSPKQMSAGKMIRGNTERLSLLIHDLLDLSRLESGRVKLDLKTENLEELLRHVIGNYRQTFKDKSIKLRLVTEKSLPSVRIDRESVVQVLTNLLDNALKFSNAEVKIVVSQNEASRVMVSVFNDGPGISFENQRRLFNKFEQLERPSGGAGYKGTGLGLVICREIIERHGEKIWVASEGRDGVTFSFTVPVHVEGNLSCHAEKDIDCG